MPENDKGKLDTPVSEELAFTKKPKPEDAGDAYSQLVAKLEERIFIEEKSGTAVKLDEGVTAGFTQDEIIIYRAALNDFELFVERIMPWSFVGEDFVFKMNWHHRLWCKDVQNNARVCELGPRYSLKSTVVGYSNTLWRIARLQRFGIYISYKEDMSTFHLGNIKELKDRNKFFTNFKDLNPRTTASLHYQAGRSRSQVRVLGGGVFSFKRGMHPWFIILDDILPDAQEKLVTPLELQRIEHQVNSELLNMPRKNGGTFAIIGTPQDPHDVLYNLRKNPGFKWRSLPAETNTAYGIVGIIDETGEQYDELWDQYNKKWLREQESTIGPKAYSREFLLVPASLSEMYFKRKEQIDPLVDPTLPHYTIDNPYIPKDPMQTITAGLDVGKKQHPSHLAIFAKEGASFIQVASIYFDNLDYTIQVDRVNEAIEGFGIDILYWDNTRGELEDRGMNPEVCVGISFAVKNRNKMATALESAVVQKRIRFLNDTRQIEQICQVRNDLSAMSTAMGHGDAFFSCMMAVCADEESEKKSKARTVGDVQAMFKGRRISSDPVAVMNRRINQPWAFNEEARQLAEQMKDAKSSGGPK